MRAIVTRLPVLLLTLAALVVAIPAGAAELLMFERDGCPYCAQWVREIGPGYPASPEGQVAPLRKLDYRNIPADIAISKPVTMTPTFVLVDHGVEVGRITGYPGSEFFYWLLDGALEQAKLRPAEPGRAAEASP